VEESELAGLRAELEGFAAEVFEGFARSDQRATGLRYLRGLMLEGKRKSMQPMAERLGVDHQQLQQFLTSSTWDYVAVRRRLAARIIDVVAPQAWVIDDTGFAKDGTASPCVARQYSGTLGKVGNCQVAVSLHAVTDAASGVLDWRLYVPPSWDETHPETSADPATAAAAQTRRARAKLPDHERHRPKWAQALEMIDELAGWGHVPPVVVADAGYGQSAPFRTGLSERGIPYVLAVPSGTSAHPAAAVPISAPYSGKGRPRSAGYPDPKVTVAVLATAAGREAATSVNWRAGTRIGPGNRSAAMSSHFTALRVRPASRGITPGPDGTLAECWLIAEWPPETEAPTDYWLSDLPGSTPLAELVRLAKIRWRIEHDYRELKTGLGLDHFEGRTFTGWNRHVTLATAAQLFLTQLRLSSPDIPKADGQA
jgi:SRSO17 transposase